MVTQSIVLDTIGRFLEGLEIMIDKIQDWI